MKALPEVIIELEKQLQTDMAVDGALSTVTLSTRDVDGESWCLFEGSTVQAITLFKDIDGLEAFKREVAALLPHPSGQTDEANRAAVKAIRALLGAKP